MKKPVVGPAKLRRDGAKEAAARCKAFERTPDDYRTGRKTFKFKSSVYGAQAVKRALWRAQHDKCCFCESKVTHISYGDVEHFRPKAGYRQEAKDELGRPGYYWLAYEWCNLYFSCQICNQRHKKNLFPLRNPRRRVRSHSNSIEREEPLFIKPSEEVERLIGFRKEYPYAIRGNRRAAVTIEELGLKRDELVEVRRDRLGKLKVILESYRLLERQFPPDNRPRDVRRHMQKLAKKLGEAKMPSAEYAAMARAAIGALDDE